MDRFISAILLLALLGFSAYSESEKPIPARYAVFASIFLIVTAVDVKHDSMYILLYSGVVCLASGIYAMLNSGQTYNDNYPTEEIAEHIRRSNIFFFMSVGIPALVLYFGTDVLSQYVRVALCVMLTAGIFINAHQSQKISKQIKEWKNERVLSGYLPTDTEIRTVNRSYVRAGLIVLAGFAVSIMYLLI